MRIKLLELILTIIVLSVSCALDFNYHKYDELTDILTNFTKKYGQVSPRLYSIGKSFKGKNLWVVEITAANRSEPGVPNVKLIGNIHGNEAVGRELLLHFLEFLADQYGKEPSITWLMKNTKLHILPSMNPDGFGYSSEGLCTGEHGRYNGRGVDLNRNFPDYFNKNNLPTQSESEAVQRWMNEVPFILSASLHGGALVANYPFDTVKEMMSLPKNPPSISADDDVFVHLAKVYSNRHPTMHLGKSCPGSTENFTGGITNGAAWYPFAGGMQDYNYAMHGCMELTLEISCCKYPHSKELPKLWANNKYALLDFVKQAHRGVRGIIFDRDNGTPIAGAVLKITGRNMNFTSSKMGEFWRILLPGKYELQVKAAGYHPTSVKFEVIAYKKTQPKLTVLSIPLVNISLPQVVSTTTVKTTVNRSTPLLSSTETPLIRNIEDKQKNLSNRFRGENVEDVPITASIHVLLDSNHEDSSNATDLWSHYNAAFILCFILPCYRWYLSQILIK